MIKKPFLGCCYIDHITRRQDTLRSTLLLRRKPRTTKHILNWIKTSVKIIERSSADGNILKQLATENGGMQMMRTALEKDTQTSEHVYFPSLCSGLVKVFMVNLCCIPIRFIFNSVPTILQIFMCSGSVLFLTLLIFLCIYAQKKHPWATKVDELQDYVFYIILLIFYYLFLEGYKSQELFGYRRYIMVAFNIYLWTYLSFSLIKYSAPKWSNNEPWTLFL